MSNRFSCFRLLSLVLGGTFLLSGVARADTPYLGEIRCGVWGYAPRGWASLNGQTLPINQNQALFALLGTNYGGNGQTTFALPDMRGRVLLSMGQGPGLSDHPVGERGGSETNTLTQAQMSPHNHAVALAGSANEGDTQSPVGKAPASQARTTLYAPPSPSPLAMSPASVSSAGGHQPVNNVQPSLPLTCVIALQGIFPSQN